MWSWDGCWFPSAALGLGVAKGAELGVGAICGSGGPLCIVCGQCVYTGARLLPGHGSFSSQKCQTPSAGKGDAQEPCSSHEGL